jgi:hypothetical protein
VDYKEISFGCDYVMTVGCCLFPQLPFRSLSKRFPLKPGTRFALGAFVLFLPLFISTSDIVRPLFLPRRYVRGQLFLSLRPD